MELQKIVAESAKEGRREKTEVSWRTVKQKAGKDNSVSVSEHADKP
jgi:hypothetical protein